MRPPALCRDMTYIASLNTEPPQSEDFDDEQTAIAWAREHAGGMTWTVAEFLPGQPPRHVASGLADDIDHAG